MVRDRFKEKRWADFRARAEASPELVYRHRSGGWEYIPVHPFGDEMELLARLDMRPEDCLSTDAWCGIDGDATLLESSVTKVSGPHRRLTVHAVASETRRLHVHAVFDAPFVTRALFEEAMAQLAAVGFPGGPRFRLHPGDDPVEITSAPLAAPRSKSGPSRK